MWHFLFTNSDAAAEQNASKMMCVQYTINLWNVGHKLISKLVPHPQLLVARGLLTLNWLPINSVVKSTTLPDKSSRDAWSMTTWAWPPCGSVSSVLGGSKTVSSTSSTFEDGSSVMRYWKPWQPPLVTVIRRCWLSWDEEVISLRRWVSVSTRLRRRVQDSEKEKMLFPWGEQPTGIKKRKWFIPYILLSLEEIFLWTLGCRRHRFSGSESQ